MQDCRETLKTPPILLRPAEVADRLGLHPVTVRRMIRTGRIRAVRIGGFFQRVPIAELDRITRLGIPKALGEGRL